MIDLTEQIRARYEKRLKKVLKINRHLTYNKDLSLGPIGSWILTSQKGIDSALKILVEKNTAVFIHQKYGSAVVLWEYMEQDFIIQTWFNKIMASNHKTKSLTEVRDFMIQAWNFCKTRKS